MKIIKRLTIFLLAFSAGGANESFVEAKIGYFLPTNSRFKESYSGGAIYELEFDYQIWKPVYSWVGVDFFPKSGYTDGDNNSTKLKMVRINLGLSYLYQACWGRPYVGAGPQASYLHTWVDSHYLIHKRAHWGIGALVKAGILFDIIDHLLLDIFTDYSWQKVNMKKSRNKNLIIHQANISGFTFGAGLGYKF